GQRCAAPLRRLLLVGDLGRVEGEGRAVVEVVRRVGAEVHRELERQVCARGNISELARGLAQEAVPGLVRALAEGDRGVWRRSLTGVLHLARDLVNHVLAGVAE